VLWSADSVKPQRPTDRTEGEARRIVITSACDLAVTLEILVAMREGNSAHAAEMLESAIDNDILSIAANLDRTPGSTREAVEGVINRVKEYRKKHPRDPRPELFPGDTPRALEEAAAEAERFLQQE